MVVPRLHRPGGALAAHVEYVGHSDGPGRPVRDRALPRGAATGALTGLSPKRLIARFRTEVGLTPKAYARVRRFQAALRLSQCASITMQGVEQAHHL